MDSYLAKRTAYIVADHQKRGLAIKIIIHDPETLEEQALLEVQAAKIHAQYVAQYVERLNCPEEQKLKLLDAVARTVLARCEANGEV